MTPELRWLIDTFKLKSAKGSAVNDKLFFEGSEYYHIVRHLKRAVEHEKVELAYPVCIPSCNNRTPSALQSFDKISSPVYLFIYERQKRLYDYITQENVHKVLVPDEFLTIQRMRKYMQDYMGDQIYWMIDDDLVGAEVIRNRIKVSWPVGLFILDQLVKERGVMEKIAIGGIAQSTENFFYPGKKKLGESFNIYAVQIYLLNGKLLRENGIGFTGDPTVNEDVEINVQMNQKKLKIVRLTGVTPVFGFTAAGKGSIASAPTKMKLYTTNNYKKFGEWCKFKVYPHDEYPTSLPRKSPVEKDPEIERLIERQEWKKLRDYVLYVRKNK